MRYYLPLLLLLLSGILKSQNFKTPLEIGNYQTPTGYAALSEYIQQADKESNILSTEILGQSSQGRNIYALKFSTGTFGQDKTKARILIFAQQHGNEQSGKEGVLLLTQYLLNPENQYLLKNLDIVLIPQVNPDGAEVNRRRNGHNADLNRNHLIMEEPEVMALHKLFDTYLFEITMDVHEYAPYGETWKAYGYRCNSDELIGCVTNINIPLNIRNFENQQFVPFYRDFLTTRHFTNSIYAPGGPPEIEYIRHSTFDINDGRQSMGIQNSFSLIQEGLNGYDNFKDSLRHRAEGQMNGMLALLEFSAEHKKEIKNIVKTGRDALIKGNPDSIAIQLEHTRNGKIHDLPVYSYATGKDSIIRVKDYRPVVHALYTVSKPAGYLIPKDNKLLTAWAERCALVQFGKPDIRNFILEQYEIGKIDSMDFEGDKIVNPEVTAKVVNGINPGDYIYIPTAQLKGNLVVIALEPKSELGLVTYTAYSQLLRPNEKFPVLRVIRKK